MTANKVEKFTFFFVATHPFCQWYPSKFTLDDITYNCTEQYMMYQKALLFKDLENAKKILKTKDADKQKIMGRRVKNFDDDIWLNVCKDIVKKANIAKFTQNPYLKKFLFNSAGTTIVEASPYDCRWGIGCDEGDPRAQKRETWRGDNWLGEILTEVREELMALENGNQNLEPSKDSIEKYTFFFGIENPLSQWYPSSFNIREITYDCAEQYMMHQKALLFGDYQSAKKIMGATHPGEQKRLGRNVKGFIDDIWVIRCKQIVKDGNKAKFTQNPELKDILLKTKGTIIAEASRSDKRWGIGFSENDPRSLNREIWQGENWLGEILTELREEIEHEQCD